MTSTAYDDQFARDPNLTEKTIEQIVGDALDKAYTNGMLSVQEPGNYNAIAERFSRDHADTVQAVRQYAAKVGGWQPWATAPKDRAVIVYGGAQLDTPVSIKDGSPSAQVIAAWDANRSTWWYARGQFIAFGDKHPTAFAIDIPLHLVAPTHWRELPAAPSQSAQQAIDPGPTCVYCAVAIDGTQRPDAGEPVAYWAAVNCEGDIEYSCNADDANGGDFARDMCNQHINGRLNEGDALLRLKPLYADHVPAPHVAQTAEGKCVLPEWHDGACTSDTNDPRNMQEQSTLAAPPHSPIADSGDELAAFVKWWNPFSRQIPVSFNSWHDAALAAWQARATLAAQPKADSGVGE